MSQSPNSYTPPNPRGVIVDISPENFPRVSRAVSDVMGAICGDTIAYCQKHRLSTEVGGAIVSTLIEQISRSLIAEGTKLTDELQAEGVDVPKAIQIVKRKSQETKGGSS